MARQKAWTTLTWALGAMATLLAGAGASLGGADNYQFYIFPPQDGYVYNGNYSAINDLGVVVGSVVNDDPFEGGAAFWANGVLTDVWSRHIDEGLDLQGFAAISNTGLLAANGERFSALRGNAFIIEGDTVLDMQVPPECQENDNALGISRNGAWLAGQCRANVTNLEIATLYDTKDGSAILLGFPPEAPPDSRGWANAVNDHGTVVAGAFYAGEGFGRVLLWQDGQIAEIPNPLEGEGFALYDLNNQGIAVGVAVNESGTYLAVLYDVGVDALIVLGCGNALAVNELNQAVGWDTFASISYATLYENGATTYLNEFLPEGWFNPTATDINNYGWIIGWAFNEIGNQVYWLLVPIYPKGDYDGDEDVDMHDFGHFQRCYAAEPYIDGTLHVGCSVFDFDDDVDLDLTDYDAFQAAFTGAITSGW